MSYRRTTAEAWTAWCATSRSAAEARWAEVEAWAAWRPASRDAVEAWWTEAGRAEREKLARPMMSGKLWLDATRARLVHLAELGILAPREQGRIAQLDYGQLASSDQKRLKDSGLLRRDLFAFAVAPEETETGKVASKEGAPGEVSPERERLSRSALTLNPGKRLRDGKLSFQVFIDVKREVPVGMNIKLRGTDPARADRPIYLRYDLDVVEMGERAGPVTHFRAHWHTGDNPDADDAEHHDSRLPSMPLNPLAVIEILVETFFPYGPADVEKLKPPR